MKKLWSARPINILVLPAQPRELALTLFPNAHDHGSLPQQLRADAMALASRYMVSFGVSRCAAQVVSGLP
jgi:hypothetical protein